MEEAIASNLHDFARSLVREEKQRLQATLNKFIPPTGNVRQLTQLMVKGVRENLDYTKPSQLLRLSTPLSKSERLLLICFGYEMSAADGEMDASERRYLELIADRLNINPQHLAVLEAVFSHQETVDPAALEEVQSLLDPSRFHELDTVFVKAASNILGTFPAKPEPQAIPQQPITSKVASDVPSDPTAQPETPATQQHQAASYPELEKFQRDKKQLDNLCNQISQIIQECNQRDFLPKTLIQEAKKVSKKLQSQRFRLAVVGEFSQGKSTLLNALLGEKIQPVRAIPCSGSVTVLKYGAQKRVVCRYKDGREEEIPFDQYQVKAAIPKEAARDHRSDELAESDIEEIILEHPDLDLCRSGVEILDSPGLNEHPERTAITQKLLNDTDAVIFLTNAMRLLPEKEKELIEDVRTQLNGGQENQPVENLFVLVNFMDLLDEEEDTQDVMQRIERFVKENNLFIAGEKRIHYISAKAALKAIVNGTDDKYLEAFQSFTKSIEKFLTIERGSLEIQQSVTKVKGLIQSSLDSMHQAEDILDGKVKLSNSEKQNILEQIGEASGRDVKIQNLANQLKKQASQEAIEYWEQWKNGLGDRMAKKSEKWSSNHSPIFSQKKLIEDYINKCIEELKAEINAWGDKQLRDVILKRNLKLLDDTIYRELESIKAELKNLDHQVKTHVSEQLDLAIHGINDDFIGDRAFLGGIGVGGAVAAALIFLTPLGWVAVITGSLAAAIVGEFGSGLVGFDGIRDQIKRKVCEMGVQKLKESPVDKKLNEIVSSVVDNRVESASQVIAQAISLCENLLEQQEKAHKETLEQREADKAWISQKRQELEQVQKNIEAILPS